jgi:hypothetical protein
MRNRRSQILISPKGYLAVRRAYEFRYRHETIVRLDEFSFHSNDNHV